MNYPKSNPIIRLPLPGPVPASRPLNRIGALAALSALAFLSACNTTEPGVDEYQNAKVDAAAAGRSLSGSFQLGKDWDAAVPAPSAPASFGLSAQTGILRKSTALPGRDLGAEFKIDLGDTAEGYATLTLETSSLLTDTWDTVVVKWDDKARDAVKDNENILRYKRVAAHAGGKVETLVITDADGDGTVNAAPGSGNRARFVFSTALAGTVETADLIVGAGADNDFDAESDNTVHKALWTRTKAGVETARGEFLDGDGDGTVGDNSKDGLVIAKWFEQNPAGRPLVRKVTAEAKLKVFANKAGDEPVSFSASEELVTGRVNAISMKNRHGTADILRNDTLWVTIETTKAAAGDTLKHAELVVVMNPGNDLKSEADDLCYAIHVKTQKKFGFERNAEFHFVAGQPVPHGQEPVSGTFEGKAVYANGQTATLKGSFSPSGFSAEFTGPEGNTVKVELTRSGDVI